MPTSTKLRALLPLAIALSVFGCAEPEGREDLETEHDEPSDLEPVDNEKFDGPLEAFTADLLFEDTMFTNSSAVTAAGVQDLLEVSPYGGRSFLADLQVAGQPFSQVLVDVAKSKQLNPILLLVRLQVEKSLVSKKTNPGGNAVDFALGCGCPDRKSCNEAYRGMDKQLLCGADTLRQHFDASVAGTGTWRVGKVTKTLDPRNIQPRSHGTASLYAYTPWVLEGSGGNWLVWNVSRKYISAMIDRGTWGTSDTPDDPTMPGELGSCEDKCGSTSAVSQGDGQACFCDDECGANGDCCDDYAMVCGGDPTDTGDDDSTGEDPTDTGEDPTGEPTGGSCEGYCGSQSGMDNGDGTSCYCDASCELSGDCCSDYAMLCGDEPSGGSCAGACGSPDPIDVGDGTSCYCDELCASNGDCCADYDAECY